MRLLHRPFGLLRLGILWIGDLTPRRPHPPGVWAGQGLGSEDDTTVKAKGFLSDMCPVTSRGGGAKML